MAVVTYEVNEASVGAYRGADLRVAELSRLEAPLGSIEAEGTDLSLGLVVLHGDQIVAERNFDLSVRFRVDNVVHLWHDRGDAVSATFTLDPIKRRLGISITFAPVGNSAARAADAAEFLHHASAEGAQLALRLPDGSIGPERISMPPAVRIDEKMVRLLRLIADIARLSNEDIRVPDDINEELVGELIMARQLLSGQPVRRRWQAAEVKLDNAAKDLLKEALAKSSRHELLQVADMWLNIGELTIPLGQVQQQFSDAVVEDLVADDGEGVVLRLRAYGGAADVEMRPTILAPPPIEAHRVIPEDAFNELLADLDTPARPNKLRELM